jgi:hypothetical protein
MVETTDHWSILLAKILLALGMSNIIEGLIRIVNGVWLCTPHEKIGTGAITLTIAGCLALASAHLSHRHPQQHPRGDS